MKHLLHSLTLVAVVSMVAFMVYSRYAPPKRLWRVTQLAPLPGINSHRVWVARNIEITHLHIRFKDDITGLSIILSAPYFAEEISK